MQYDFNLRPVDFVGQYMRGKTFREDMEEAKRKRQDTEEAKAMLKQTEADAQAEKELIQDIRIADYYMDNGMYDQALAHTDQRMQRLSQQGRDVSDTGEIYDLMRSGDYATAHGMLKAGLAGLGQLQEKSKGDKSEPLHDNIKIGEGGELIGRNRETGVYEVIPSEVKARGATPQVQVGSGESAYDKEIAKYDAEVFKSLKEQKREAGKSNRALARMLKLNDEALSGAGSGLKQTVLSLANSIGFEVDKTLSATEMFNALSNDLTLGQTSKLTGPLTDKDMEFLSATVPQLKNSVEGRRMIIQYMKTINDASIEKARTAEKYAKDRNGRFSDSGFQDYYEQQMAQRNLLQDFYGDFGFDSDESADENEESLDSILSRY